MTERKTKTLLVTNITNHPDLISKIKSNYDTKEIYSIPNNETLIFVIFYNLKESEKCYKDLQNINIEVYFTVSKYEIPKDQDKCDSRRNQSTLFITLKNNLLFTEDDMLKKYGDIKDIRTASTNIKCVEYYDSRSADKCFKEMNLMKWNNSELNVRYVWDISTKIKWELIRITDSIIGQQIVKKKPVIKKNIFVELFDEFIVENIDEIDKMFDNKS